MNNQRQNKERKVKRISRTDNARSMFMDEVALIVNYPEMGQARDQHKQSFWSFSYFLCDTRWSATAIVANDFSELFTSSGRSTGFIEESQHFTNRTKPGNRSQEKPNPVSDEHLN